MTTKNDGCPKCGYSIITIDNITWRCIDQRYCGWEGNVPPAAENDDDCNS